MPSQKKAEQSMLRLLVKDSRIHPHRRFLAAMLLLRVTHRDDPEFEFYDTLVRIQFMNKNGTAKLAGANGTDQNPPGIDRNMDADAAKHIQEQLNNLLLGGGNGTTVSSTAQ